jgi:hypothetical protein
MRYKVTGVMRFPPSPAPHPQEWEWHTFVTDEGPEEAILSSMGLFEHRERFREEVVAWCEEMIGPHLWRINQSDTVFISRPEDAVAFRMKWA